MCSIPNMISGAPGRVSASITTGRDWCRILADRVKTIRSREITIVRRTLAHFARLAGNRSHHGARRDDRDKLHGLVARHAVAPISSYVVFRPIRLDMLPTVLKTCGCPRKLPKQPAESPGPSRAPVEPGSRSGYFSRALLSANRPNAKTNPKPLRPHGDELGFLWLGRKRPRRFGFCRSPFRRA